MEFPGYADTSDRRNTAFDIVFMGTPAFAVPTLDLLVSSGHRILAVVTQPPRPAGRGNRLRPSDVQIRAEELGLQVLSPASMRCNEALDALRALEPDLFVVAAYGQILSRAALAIPRLGCLNVHGSILPRWRGAAPVQRAILAGDEETGVTIMDMAPGMDTGDMRLIRRMPLARHDAGTAMAELARIGAEAMVEVLADLGGHPPVPQPSEGVTVAAKIEKSEGRLDPTLPAAHLARVVRAMNPSPGAWVEVAGERIRILCADAVGGEGVTGTFVDDRMTIACSEGLLRLNRVQRQGRSPLHPVDLTLGWPVPAGTVIG